jgi:hypothetical protein
MQLLRPALGPDRQTVLNFIVMVKQVKGGGTPDRRRKTRLWQAILAVVVLGAMVSAYVLTNRESPSSDKEIAELLSTTAPIRNRMVLPARPRNPRPDTLNPAAYTDPETKQAYQAAKDVPEALEHMACYCGCFASAGHRNNLDCFKDNHGVT